jgi:hypothetical protein
MGSTADLLNNNFRFAQNPPDTLGHSRPSSEVWILDGNRAATKRAHFERIGHHISEHTGHSAVLQTSLKPA